MLAKKSFLPLLLSLLFINAAAQDFSGSWAGIFNTDMSGVRRRFNFTMQLQQKGRAVWGTYTSSDTSFPGEIACFCRISGQVEKKNKTYIRFYKEEVIENKIPYGICDFVNYLEAEFLQQDSRKYLTGLWYGIQGSIFRSDGASGNFTVQKLADTTRIDVSAFFPNIDKLIRRFNAGDSSNQFVLVQKHESDITTVTPAIETVKPFEEREDIVLKTIETDSSEVEISLYDNGLVDDDTISVYLNKQPILTNYRLNSIAKKIYLQLEDQPDNEILIVAENLGSIPPNTGTMVVKTNGVMHRVNLSSSFETNAKIIIHKKN